jgi:magnesium chelatase family protein
MLSRVPSAAVLGVDGFIVTVETDIALGLSSFTIVGLPDVAVRESQYRVTAAVKNSGFQFPNRRVTVNLAPADVKKEGAAFDLPVALGVLVATGIVPPAAVRSTTVVGELSLDGTLRPVRGAVAMALAARAAGMTSLLLPHQNAEEAALVDGITVYAVRSLREAASFLDGSTRIDATRVNAEALFAQSASMSADLGDVRGHEHAKRALEIAAAGGHNVLMVGPPGSGKTMLARRLPSVLPPMTLDESLEATKIHSIAGTLSADRPLVAARPFRSPHHNVSEAGMVGGGSVPRPGEVSLAHNGVLFLDELPEFRRDVLESLRQPLEDGIVTIGRARSTFTFPARFMLVCAMNPCPCGFYGDARRACTCTAQRIRQYRHRISGPLLDRIDIHIEVPAVRFEELAARHEPPNSGAPTARVVAARQSQGTRFAGLDPRSPVYCNAQMGAQHVRRFCRVDRTSEEILRLAMERLGLSARAYHRILKVARTIADIDDSKEIGAGHVTEAVQYRTLDRTTW